MMLGRCRVVQICRALIRGGVCLAGVMVCLWLTSCSREVDFENDVPQRAKAISQAEVTAIRQSMGSSKAREQYRSFTQNKSEGQLKKSLAQLEKEKREIERQIALLTQAKSSNICPICRRKYNIKSTPRKHVVQKKKRASTKKTPSKTQKKAPQQPRVQQVPQQPVDQQSFEGPQNGTQNGVPQPPVGDQGYPVAPGFVQPYATQAYQPPLQQPEFPQGYQGMPSQGGVPPVGFMSPPMG